MENYICSSLDLFTFVRYNIISFLAYGIKLSVDHGFGGDVVLEAKTTELANHYINDFGAVKLPSFSGAPRLLIADDAAKRIFFNFCNKYHVRWASATEKERAFIEEITRVTYERDYATRNGLPLSEVRTSFAS